MRLGEQPGDCSVADPCTHNPAKIPQRQRDADGGSFDLQLSPGDWLCIDRLPAVNRPIRNCAPRGLWCYRMDVSCGGERPLASQPTLQANACANRASKVGGAHCRDAYSAIQRSLRCGHPAARDGRPTNGVVRDQWVCNSDLAATRVRDFGRELCQGEWRVGRPRGALRIANGDCGVVDRRVCDGRH